MKILGTTLLAGLLSMTAYTAQADLIASWMNAGTRFPYPMAATTLDSALADSGTVVLGAGLNQAWNNAAAENGLLTVGYNTTTLAAAITANDYFSFTLDVGSNFVDFDSITAYAKAQNAAADVYLLSSATGWADTDSLASFATVDGTAGGQGDLWEIDLSGVSELQTITGSVEFRFYYVTKSTATPSNFTFAGFRNPNSQDVIPDIAFYGTVPEPSTYAAIAGLLALGLAVMRRRRS